MQTEHSVNISSSETEEAIWTLLDLPGAQVAIVEDGGEIKEEKLTNFYESFSAALDLTEPDDILE
ncbi:hypothetical protein GU926_01905 [Nibribacter ruber]|uniref:Uncharacterized protein n=1 Tax=Nibribacter ruber TaxID=2698458 RepID=A0A6P1NV99_9BACT|nr:hypothetical protein [Nibribacter ruber]QHL86264.1 hypothetical protein GU926_01905 [Nibribacter ruber]